MGVVAMNTPGQNANAVAELVFGMMLVNARNNFETELKQKIAEAQKSIEMEKSKCSEMEIRKIKERYEQEFKAKEDAQAQACRNYQERDQVWQSEKQV